MYSKIKNYKFEKSVFKKIGFLFFLGIGVFFIMLQQFESRYEEAKKNINNSDELILISINEQGLSSDLREELKSIQIEKNLYFFMDGRVDVWTYILSKYKLNYQSIAVQEKGLVYFYAFFMKISNDYNQYKYLIIHFFFSIISSILIYSILLNIYGKKTAYISSIILFLFPENIHYNAVIAKDGLVLTIILFHLFCLIKLRCTNNKLFLFFIVGQLFILSFVRSGLVLPVIFITLLFYLFNYQIKKAISYLLITLFIFNLLLLILPKEVHRDIVFKIYEKPISKFYFGSSKHLDVENITYRDTIETSIVQNISGGDASINNAVWLFPKGLMYLISPFPPSFDGSLKDSGFVIFSTYLYFLMLPFLMSELIKILRNNNFLQIFLLIEMTILSVAIIFAGPFIYVRYRIIILPFLIVFFVNNFLNSNTINRLYKCIGAVLIFLIIYLFWVIMKSIFNN